jgi:hypothetical protein
VQGGFPTIFKIYRGALSYYNGPRETKPMMDWAMAEMNARKKNARKSRKPANKLSKLQKQRKNAKSKKYL